MSTRTVGYTRTRHVNHYPGSATSLEHEVRRQVHEVRQQVHDEAPNDEKCTAEILAIGVGKSEQRFAAARFHQRLHVHMKFKFCPR